MGFQVMWKFWKKKECLTKFLDMLSMVVNWLLLNCPFFSCVCSLKFSEIFTSQELKKSQFGCLELIHFWLRQITTNDKVIKNIILSWHIFINHRYFLITISALLDINCYIYKYLLVILPTEWPCITSKHTWFHL